MDPKKICVYHRIDLDGKCSAAIVKHHLNSVNQDCEFYGIDYADEFDFDRIAGHDVIMVDYTLEQPGQMEKLDKLSRMLIWIDHHETTFEIEKKLKLEHIPGLRRSGIGACVLSWEYFFPQINVPHAVYLLGSYDVWNNENENEWEEEILPFQYGMRLNSMHPTHQDEWKNFFGARDISGLVTNTIGYGKAVLKYDKQLSASMARLWFPIEFKGFKFQVINRSHANFLSGQAIWDPENYHAIMYFCKGPEKWRITMYTDREDVDLYPLAKSLDGGGHNKACGFTTTDIRSVIPQLLEF